MKIRIGYEIGYNCPQPTFMILMLNVHGSRRADIEVPDDLTTDPPVPIREYCDSALTEKILGKYPATRIPA